MNIGNGWIAKKNGIRRFVQTQEAAVAHDQVQRGSAGIAAWSLCGVLIANEV